LGVSRTWQKDLLWCSDYSYGCLAGDGGIISPFPPTSEKLRMGQVYAEVTGIAYHAAYISPAVPAIPPSIGIKYSQITVQTKLLQSLSIQEQVICPPSCRADHSLTSFPFSANPDPAARSESRVREAAPRAPLPARCSGRPVPVARAPAAATLAPAPSPQAVHRLPCCSPPPPPALPSPPPAFLHQHCVPLPPTITAGVLISQVSRACLSVERGERWSHRTQDGSTEERDQAEPIVEAICGTRLHNGVRELCVKWQFVTLLISSVTNRRSTRRDAHMYGSPLCLKLSIVKESTMGVYNDDNHIIYTTATTAHALPLQQPLSHNPTNRPKFLGSARARVPLSCAARHPARMPVSCGTRKCWPGG
jgi:hypothetical protein